ncbi:MAG: DUF6152 family protein [Pseudomonadota bacterium]
MQRRDFLVAALAVPGLAQAHHGWSSFDQDRPIYLEGRVVVSKWQNPHAELTLEVPVDLKLPADLGMRQVPAQSAPVDGKALLTRATPPRRRDRRWLIELAPLTRLEAWKMPEIKVGASISVLGFIFKEEKGEPILRAEYVFVDGKAYGLRSSPV